MNRFQLNYTEIIKKIRFHMDKKLTGNRDIKIDAKNA